MTRQTMEEKVQVILDAKAIEYAKSEGDKHYFQAGSLSEESIMYVIECVINEDKTMSWECDCPALQWSKEKPKTCKHIESAKALMVRDGIKMEYKGIPNE